MLVGAGQHVSGTTRDPARAEWLRAAGADPVKLDIYDAEAVRDAVAGARPEAVIHLLTDLAGSFGPAQLRSTARLRQVGTRRLVEAILAAGVRRLIAQSGAWLYAPGPTPHPEEHRLLDAEQAPNDPTLPRSWSCST